MTQEFMSRDGDGEEICPGGQFVEDAQDIYDTLESIGRLDLLPDAPALIVLVGEGKYDELWYTDSATPYRITSVFQRLV